MVFFTADQHFGHDNIRKLCNRPFTTVDEMDAQLIENWNRVVRSQDSVFHLGDFCLTAENTETYRKQLNGQIRLIRGDHDKRVPPGVFAAVHDSYTFESLGIRIVLCHYAMRVWDRSHFEAWHLFAHCIDTKTEILTDGGWKGYGSVKVGDVVLSYNKITGQMERDSVLEVVHFPRAKGKMYTLDTKSVSMRVTEGHTCVAFNRNGGSVHDLKAGEFFQGDRRTILRCGVLPKPGVSLTSPLLKLLVLIAADGSIKKATELVRIHLWKDRKKVYVRRVLSEALVPFKELVQADGSSSFNFYMPPELRVYRVKGLDLKLLDCNREQFEGILEAYAHSDGSRVGKNGFMIYSSKEEEIDLLQALAVQSGYGATKAGREMQGFGVKPSFRLSVFPAGVQTLTNVRNRVVSEEVNGEHVWCIRCLNGNFFARRNGRVHLTGNSHGMLPPWGKSFDIGVDAQEFTPRSLDEVIERMRNLPDRR